MPALHHVGHVVGEVVAQVVEAELVVGAVGDVAAVGAQPLVLAEPVDDHARGHAEEGVDAAHPLGVALRQVVVDGDHVHAAAGQRVEVDGQGGHQRLALAGAHLGDAAAVQHHAADELGVVVALAKHALGRLAHHGESLLQEVVQRVAPFQPGAELGGLGLQPCVRQRADLGLEGGHRGDAPAHGAHRALVGGAEELLGEGEHGRSRETCARPGGRCAGAASDLLWMGAGYGR